MFADIMTGESPLTYNCVMSRDSSIATVKAKLCDMLGIGVEAQLFGDPNETELADCDTLASYGFRVVARLTLFIGASVLVRSAAALALCCFMHNCTMSSGCCCCLQADRDVFVRCTCTSSL